MEIHVLTVRVKKTLHTVAFSRRLCGTAAIKLRSNFAQTALKLRSNIAQNGPPVIKHCSHNGFTALADSVHVAHIRYKS